MVAKWFVVIGDIFGNSFYSDVRILIFAFLKIVESAPTILD